MGFGSMALFAMMGETGLITPAGADSAATDLEARQPPLPAKAKRVIHLFMSGGPSHVYTF
jgi:hypothetical protein